VLQKVKDKLKITDNLEDSFLNELIISAQRYLESYLSYYGVSPSPEISEDIITDLAAGFYRYYRGGDKELLNLAHQKLEEFVRGKFAVSKSGRL